MKVTGRILPKFPKAVCVIILCAFFKAVAYWALTPYLPMYLGNRLGISVENSGYLIGLGRDVYKRQVCSPGMERYHRNLVSDGGGFGGDLFPDSPEMDCLPEGSSSNLEGVRQCQTK